MSFLFSVFIFLSVSAFGAAPATPPVATPANPVANISPQKAPDYTPAIISAAIAGVVSLIVGISIGRQSHSLALKRDERAREHADRREKEAKRAELLSTLKHWEKTLVVILNPDELGRTYYESGAIAALAAAAERFRGYVTDQDTFNRLNAKASNMHPKQLNANGREKARDTICAAIGQFYDFIRNA